MNKSKLKVSILFLLLAGTVFYTAPAQSADHAVGEIKALVKNYEAAQKYTLKEHSMVLDATIGRQLMEKVHVSFWFMSRDEGETTSQAPFLVKATVRLQSSTQTRRIAEFAWGPVFGLMWIQTDDRENPCGITTYYLDEGDLMHVEQRKGKGCPEKHALETITSTDETVRKFEKRSKEMVRMADQYLSIYQNLVGLTY